MSRLKLPAPILEVDMENTLIDYIGLLAVFAIVAGGLYFFWSKIKDKFK